MPFRPGPLNHRWKGGTHLNSKGYLRYSKKPLRGRYVHREVMAAMCREFCYYPPASPTVDIPEGFTVEHIDHTRTHNCPSNLLLLQKEIHDAVSWASWRAVRSAQYDYRTQVDRYLDDEIPF